MAAAPRVWPCAACGRLVPLALDACRCGALRPLSTLSSPPRPWARLAIPAEHRGLVLGLAVGTLVLVFAIYRAVTQPPPAPIVPVLGYSSEAERAAAARAKPPAAKPR
jgi:hypothetical protein